MLALAPTLARPLRDAGLHLAVQHLGTRARGVLHLRGPSVLLRGRLHRLLGFRRALCHRPDYRTRTPAAAIVISLMTQDTNT